MIVPAEAEPRAALDPLSGDRQNAHRTAAYPEV